MLRLLGLQPQTGREGVHTVEELRQLVTSSQHAGVVEASEARIASRAFTFADLTAGALMTPRTELDAVPIDIGLDALRARLAASAHTRLPVYEDSLDRIAGTLHVVEAMSRFLFLTFDAGGNQPPAIGIAQELRARGHEIVFAGYQFQGPRFTARGFPFVLLERAQAAHEQASAAGGWVHLLEGALVCPPHLEEVPEVFARERADAVLVDCMLFAALAACERAQLPAAVLVHSPPGALLRPDRVLGQGVPQPLNALRAAAGLPPVERLWDSWRRMAVLCTTVAELDPLAAEVPPECEYVGPVFERLPPSGWRSPWPAGDKRPLVLVTFSTIASQDPHGSRIRRTLAGLAGRPYRVLVTSSRADLDGIEVPENAVLVRHVPHGEVLPGAAVTVAHAGHGTVAGALAHGVPLVCLPHPIIADQVPLADHVQRLGAGRALDGERASAAEIAAAVDEVLADPTYRAAAGALARAIAAKPGARTAASRLEHLAGGAGVGE